MRTLITSCNPDKFNLFEHFKKERQILWRQTKSCEIGDEVFIYVGRPQSRLLYKCKIIAVDLPSEIVDSDYYKMQTPSSRTKNKPYMRLELVRKLDNDGLTLPDLFSHGLKTVQCTTEASPELREYLNTVVGG